MKRYTSFLLLAICISVSSAFSQNLIDRSLLTIDRIYNSNEFSQESLGPLQWIEGGNAYVMVEKSKTIPGADELVKYRSRDNQRSVLLEAEKIRNPESGEWLEIEDFSFSNDESKILIFTNSSRVWRSNTKGDYWVFDKETGSIYKLGKSFEASSLMFAKFSSDNRFVAYVHKFNLYLEEFGTGKVKQLTSDGTRDIINGTFDWVYEEEFGCRDGFRWSPDGRNISYWQLDASDIGTFYMINNIDSIYSIPIPLQYPKVGDDPSACRVGFVSTKDAKTTWIDLPGDRRQNYIPSLQWVNNDLLLVQQLNRKQNDLTVWKYKLSTGELSEIYNETEDTWVDIGYPDVSTRGWSENDITLVDNGRSFLRMTENDEWRNVYKIEITTGKKKLITKGNYDVASISGTSKNELFYMASPNNSTQRYLYRERLDGRGSARRVTPQEFAGVNRYDISDNGEYAVHKHNSINRPNTVRLISLPDHRPITELVANEDFLTKVTSLQLPKTEFFKVETEDGIEIDGRMILPIGFDENQKYPVLFHVYGEPWGQVATDSWIGLWNIMMAQKGYIVIDMDNRGTPCLKGSAWRKSIYRKIGVINSEDQAAAAREVLKWKFIDPLRTAVWGWSGGGSMTLNLLFRYPGLYKTGVSVAPVSYQLAYDNIYQERYMGLPSENMDDFIEGSPISYAHQLQDNLLLVHGTADDNVHYQNSELLINELIRHNKKFDMMAYPNRSHGIWEGENTRRHLYSLLTDYILEHTPVERKFGKSLKP